MSLADELLFVTQEPHFLRRFGRGDDQTLKKHLYMLASFLEERPPATKRTYRTGLRQFFETFEWICPEDVTPRHAMAYKQVLLNRGVSDATVYYRISALTSYFDFLGQLVDGKPVIAVNPFNELYRSDIKPMPVGERVQALPWDVFEKLVNYLPTDPAGLRDRAILLFFAFTGRRRSEIANLRISNLDTKSRPRTYTVCVKGTPRTFNLPQVCYDAIKAYWIAADRLSTIHSDSGVFTSLPGSPLVRDLDPEKPIATRTLEHRLVSAAKRAGVDLGDSRLAAIRQMDADKAKLKLLEVQGFLGQASPKTAAAYLMKLSRPAPQQDDRGAKIRAAATALLKKQSLQAQGYLPPGYTPTVYEGDPV